MVQVHDTCGSRDVMLWCVLQVVARMKQYKDDLLASCLCFLLALPTQIVASEIKSLVPALKVGEPCTF